jgi:hypothetical protein
MFFALCILRLHAMQNAALQIAGTSTIEPVTYRLPSKGVDVHFGLTRGYYYQLEAEGKIELIRLRSKGKNRGVTLVPYAIVKQLVAESAASRCGVTP